MAVLVLCRRNSKFEIEATGAKGGPEECQPNNVVVYSRSNPPKTNFKTKNLEETSAGPAEVMRPDGRGSLYRGLELTPF